MRRVYIRKNGEKKNGKQTDDFTAVHNFTIAPPVSHHQTEGIVILLSTRCVHTIFAIARTYGCPAVGRERGDDPSSRDFK